MTRCAWLLGLVLSFTTIPARAEEGADKARARQLLGDGNARYAQGDFAGALKLFRQAYDFFPSAKLLVNTAACERALGRFDRAASDLAEYLRLHERAGAPAAERELAEQARADLDAVGRSLGRIVVEVSAREAIIEVDGEESWRRAWLKPGEHLVRVREQGSLGWEVRVEAGRSETVRRPSAEAAANPTPAVEGVGNEVVKDEPPRKRPAWLIPVAVAGGVVVVGFALGLGLGLGLHRSSEPLSGDLGVIQFNPR